MTAKDKAAELHGAGFNCAQSVLCSLESDTGLERALALACAGGFGGGLRCGEICGAVSGAVMAMGLCEPFTDPANADAKSRIAALAKEYTERFAESYGCLRCNELKASGHSCGELIGYAAELAEEMIHNIETESAGS